MEDIDKIFAAALRSQLKRRGSQSRLAENANISRQYANDLVNGRRSGSETQRRKIAAILGYPGPQYEDFLNIGRATLDAHAVNDYASTEGTPDNFYTYFRLALREAVKERGAQARLSRNSGIAPNYINNIVKGRDDGSEETRRKIATALGYQYDDFLNIGRQILAGKTVGSAAVEISAAEAAPHDKNDINQIFLAALKHLAAKEPSQRQLALRAGITRQYLNNILLGKSSGTDATKRNIALALGYPGAKYEDFLNIGRALLAAPQSGPPELSEDDKKLIAGAPSARHLDRPLLIEVVVLLEDFLAEHKKALNARLKAEIIVQMYELLKEREEDGRPKSGLAKIKEFTPILSKALSLAIDAPWLKTG